MSVDPLAILKSAGLAARAAARVPESGRAGEFAAMLAGRGSIPISIAPGVDARLTASQLARIAPEAEKAEARGAGRAIVLVDGQAYALDVGTRTITGKVDLTGVDASSGFDAVLSVPPAPTVVADGAAMLRQLGRVLAARS